ncbi:sucrose synthase [Aetokthonos hydrillicola Thurmond2011]|jgi:sucrose synthase|uniref:Sucrose synthase n=1 Tax=Aetokthonos hydrillicola Thurmond2011 TaxID=2712845 RepID=A0AAP5MBK9_9CYAN|nr:sucrose synthase [Aetokthonos hydrillicola]MBO3460324.1 sucrose synthase [Aetokthonos hydrillicola CCALA 1050]MBW4590777.1 sucrose synthase [Aetokthonos hydrillicola CCALA 1050]MDR9898037.1 sucrose synthase [Aetokthonos hydrillicola Thurmond2011]
MHELVKTVLNSEEKTALRQLLFTLSSLGKKFFLRNEILQAFADYCYKSQKPAYFYHSSSVGKLINYTHEIILEDDSTWFVVRQRVASQEVWRLAANMASFEMMTPQALLNVRDRLVNRFQPRILEIDFNPFYQGSPTINDPRNIGQGLAFLNRHLCSQVLTDPEYWLEVLFNVLHRRRYDGIPILINDRIHSGQQLSGQIKEVLNFLRDRPPNEPYEKIRFDLQEFGLEPGWGNTSSRIRETLELLARLITTPEPAILEAFVERIPAVFRVVLVSIHGWVSQEGVLGRPETAGQVIYVLEQARSLENKLREEIKLAGLDVLGIQPQVIILTRLIPNCEGTLCSLRLEKVLLTENAWILRVPFHDSYPPITQEWISKFEIWPYLEKFAIDAERELLAQLRGAPDLIIGNYSDGNLVAFLLARSLKVTHCNIAHSLEKPKHLFSNLYWQDLEDQFHFSAQFTADLINMNAADFIITSTYQEIMGTPDTIGQYESYKCFSMPSLYHVVDGIDLLSPKFNMVPPGVDENIFFSYDQTEQRDPNLRTRVHDLLFTRKDPLILGLLTDPSKRPIFAVGSIASIDNLAGLAECFGKSEALQEQFNLILVTGKLYPEQAKNSDETDQINKLHRIINQYHLQGHIRWLGMYLPIIELGEAYRVIADQRGIFVHFAHFEAFGRTILEAMSSGLPAFAAQFGGSLEIINDSEENEFHLNPTDLEGTAKKILNFINQCNTEEEYWYKISEWVSQRVRIKYNWHSHIKQLLLLSKIYSFWKFVSPENREARDRYLEALFYLVYKPRAEIILQQHMQKR